MKKYFIITSIFCVLLVTDVQAQSLMERLKKAETIYVESLPYADAFAVVLGPKTDKPRYNYWEEPSLEWEYEASGDNVKIVAQFDPQKLQKFNNKIMNKCKEVFGAEKVKPWPDEYKNSKGKMKPKGHDADFYIVLKRDDYNVPFLIEKKDDGKGGRDFFFNDRGEELNLTLYEVKKKGKKGDEVVEVTTSMFDALDGVKQNFTDKGDIKAGLYKDLINQFYGVMNKELDKMIEEFFNKIENS
ncbi:MAG TPA: hypothetical protein ACFCUD_08855 [Cyclobacteriaceae bacterium]